MGIIITIKFHQLMLHCHFSIKYSLSRIDDDSNQFQLVGELFLTQTQTFPVRVASSHLWYNLGTVAGPICAAPSRILPVC